MKKWYKIQRNGSKLTIFWQILMIFLLLDLNYSAWFDHPRGSKFSLLNLFLFLRYAIITIITPHGEYIVHKKLDFNHSFTHPVEKHHRQSTYLNIIYQSGWLLKFAVKFLFFFREAGGAGPFYAIYSKKKARWAFLTFSLLSAYSRNSTAEFPYLLQLSWPTDLRLQTLSHVRDPLKSHKKPERIQLRWPTEFTHTRESPYLDLGKSMCGKNFVNFLWLLPSKNIRHSAKNIGHKWPIF